jgi:omega-6 fatty acid desaturase (delta-12 desaturase)
VPETDAKALRETLRSLQQPHHGRSLWELAVSAVPFVVLWTAAFVCMQRGWWWAGLALAVPAGLFLVRMFLIQHDCGHQAFFRSSAANNWVGRIIGALTLTPYEYWRRTHAIHHTTSGNLDRRDLGAIETLTVAEYRALPFVRRAAYRIYRHPLVMLGLGPSYMFILQHRLPIGLMREGWAWRSVMGVNLAIAVAAIPFALTGTLLPFLATHAAVTVVGATLGVWLFYVQHQFEESYWARQREWSAADAALVGSSHLALPQPLQWLTANIGIHHVHHLAARVPFYRLPQALESHPAFRDAPRLRIRDAFAALTRSLWDEQAGRLVTFSQARALHRRPELQPALATS